MVPEGEAQPDNPEQQVLLEVQKSSKITCGSYLEERQQDHVGSPMAAGARRAAREERERKRGEPALSPSQNFYKELAELARTRPTHLEELEMPKHKKPWNLLRDRKRQK